METVAEIRNRFDSSDEELRRNAVASLCNFPFAEVKSLALQALGDSSWRVRKESASLITANAADEDLLRELVALLSVQGNAGLRNSVVEVLQAAGDAAVAPLLEKVDDSDPGVRKFIVDTIGGIGSAAALPRLVMILDDSDPNVAAAAAESLGMIGDADAAPALIRILERDDLLIRYAALAALAKTGTPLPLTSLPPLAADPLLKKALVETLGVVGAPDSLGILVEAITDRRRNVREAAVVAIAALRSRFPGEVFLGYGMASLKGRAGDDTLECLLAMIENSKPEVRLAVIPLLGQTGGLKGLDALVMLCRDESLITDAVAAIRSIGEDVGEYLLNRYAGSDEETKSVILYLCGEINFAGSIKIMEEGLKEKHPQLRAMAAEAIGRTGHSDLIATLALLLTDENSEVRRRVTSALVRLATLDFEQVASSAIALAEEDCPDSKVQAVRLFAAIKDISHLFMLGKDEDCMVRREAVLAIGELRVPETAERLALALADEDADVRVAAANALSWSGFVDDRDALCLALEDSSQRVQAAAIKSLGSRGGGEAFEQLVPFISSPSGMLKVSAMQALVCLDPVRVLPLLRQCVADQDPDVVRVATALLKKYSGEC